MQTIKTALSSFGLSGKVFHAPFLTINKGFELVKVLERTKDNAKSMYPTIETVRNYKDCLSNDIDLVVINTPDNTHYSMAKEALEAKKHVIVEKPFTINTNEAIELKEIAEKNNCMLSVFQNRRWDSDFLTIKEIIHRNLLGRIVSMESNFSRYRPIIADSWKENPETGTGNIYNLGTHLIDQALHLFGMPDYLCADIDKLRDHAKVDDYFNINLYYPRMKIRLHSSYLCKKNDTRFIIHGTNGSYSKQGFDMQEDLLKAGNLPQGENWGKEVEKNYGTLYTENNGIEKIIKYPSLKGNYMEYYNDIYNAITQKKQALVTAEDGIRCIYVVEKALESSKTKQIIKLNYTTNK